VAGDKIAIDNSGMRATNTRWAAAVTRSRVIVPSPPRGARYLVLARGELAIVDAIVFGDVRRYSWRVKYDDRGKAAAVTTIVRENGHRFALYLHRYVIDAAKGALIDHRDGNVLDNRRANLRVASASQSSWNGRKRDRGTSRFKGVSAHPNGSWYARISARRRSTHLGYFKTERAAALAYDVAARRLHGKFACVNFPRKGEQHALRGT
jgi:hypothetical protein